MPIPRHFRNLADKFGAAKKPGQSDGYFIQLLKNLEAHYGLVDEAEALGIDVPDDIATEPLRELIVKGHRRLLAEAGIVVNATVPFDGKQVQIRKIREAGKGSSRRLLVQYWIESPWRPSRSRKDDRTVEIDATNMLVLMRRTFQSA